MNAVHSNHASLWGAGACMTVLLFVGCAENPGTWPRDKVSSQVKESLELETIELEARDDGGGFRGQGMRDGETIRFTVEQDAASRRIEWDAKGDRGFEETGYYELR